MLATAVRRLLVVPLSCGVVVLGTTAAAAVPSPATSYPGDLTTCTQLGFNADDLVAAGGNGYAVSSNGTSLSVTAVPSGKQVDALVVAGGNAVNVYPGSSFTSLPVTGLQAPGNATAIDHWFLCAGPVSEQPAGPPAVPTRAAITGTCTSASVTVDGGSTDAQLRLDPAGAAPARDLPVAARAESVQQVALSAAGPTVSVVNDAAVLATYTRPPSCDSGGSQGGIDPKVLFDTSCVDGIVVVLSNMRLDDTTTLPVTFAIVTPAGDTQNVTVPADHIVKRFYAVAEDTTGVVTVSAPGMATVSKSYARNCVKVLGEKVVRTPGSTGGTGAGRLPMTGVPIGPAAALGAGLCLGGWALSRGARRSPRRPSGA